VSVFLFSCSAVFSLQREDFRLQKLNLTLSDMQHMIVTLFSSFIFLGTLNIFGACQVLGICYKAKQLRKCPHSKTLLVQSFNHRSIDNLGNQGNHTIIGHQGVVLAFVSLHSFNMTTPS
jgi:hypothetical protein